MRRTARAHNGTAREVGPRAPRPLPRVSGRPGEARPRPGEGGGPRARLRRRPLPLTSWSTSMRTGLPFVRG